VSIGSPKWGFLLFDRDAKFGADGVSAVRDMGSEPIRTAFRSPWQNGVAERWVGTCRRDLLDHVNILNERHLKRPMSAYLHYEDWSQVGRVRYTAGTDKLDEEVPFQSVDEILASRRDGDLFRYLLEKFAVYSGISGIQPKVLVRDDKSFARRKREKPRPSPSHRGATHIVKFWEPNEYPQLAANEYFCLKVAERCELEVPKYRLAEDGMALVVDRFDLREDGTYRGFEDFCVLNARRAEEKYRGSYETSVMKRFGDFAKSTSIVLDLEKLFTLITLNCALRNGDAHLKNFGIVYDDVLGEARLAPVYDLVTTGVYVAKDSLALTLNGTTAWPEGKVLRRLGEARMSGSPAKVREIFDRISDALSKTTADVRSYVKEHPDFDEIGGRMLEEWDKGRRHSLQ
jgi:serine/threonine-protein kinase HipA